MKTPMRRRLKPRPMRVPAGGLILLAAGTR
jgi:hypothetical protein